MKDTIYAGVTWRRLLDISDELGPVDPADMSAVMCPEIRIAIDRTDVGQYELLLTEEQTANLTPGERRWEVWGRIGADLTMITAQTIFVIGACGP